MFVFLTLAASAEEPNAQEELTEVYKHFLNDENNAKQDQIRVGMSRDEIRDTFGSPDKVFRQILFKRYVEQWVYEKSALWVQFNCLKGQEPFVCSYHNRFRP
jgi:hypothetical protein